MKHMTKKLENIKRYQEIDNNVKYILEKISI